MDTKRQSHHRLARLAGEQHGVVELRQLRGLGYEKEALRRAKEAGRIHLVDRGVYAIGHPALTKHGRCLAAVLSCGEGALLSHRSAAWLWGLTTRFTSPVEVTAKSPRRTRLTIGLHSAEALRAGDATTSVGIPVTAIPRTLLDFAATDPSYLVQALNNARRLGLLDFIAIDELIERSKGFRGVARLREALLVHRPREFTRSGLERQFLRLASRAGLPKPSMNLFIEGYELDAYWAPERFAVELDTYDYHGDPIAFEKDRLRQEDLKLAGIEMTRVTGVRMDREPGAVATRLRRLLAQRRHDLAILTRSPQG